MNPSPEEYLSQPYGLRIRPITEYQTGSKVVFAYDPDFAVVIPAGTFAMVRKVAADHLSVELLYTPGRYKQNVLELLRGDKEVYDYHIDLLGPQDASIFRDLGDWVPCRKSNDQQGWHTPEDRYVYRVLLKKGELLEGEMYRASTLSGFATGSGPSTGSLRFGERMIKGGEIDNLMYKRQWPPYS